MLHISKEFGFNTQYSKDAQHSLLYIYKVQRRCNNDIPNTIRTKVEQVDFKLMIKPKPQY